MIPLAKRFAILTDKKLLPLLNAALTLGRGLRAIVPLLWVKPQAIIALVQNVNTSLASRSLQPRNEPKQKRRSIGIPIPAALSAWLLANWQRW